jgi:hypothetical protein
MLFSRFESARCLPLVNTVFGLLVNLKPFDEANVTLKAIHTLNPNGFGRKGASQRSYAQKRTVNVRPNFTARS